MWPNPGACQAGVPSADPTVRLDRFRNGFEGGDGVEHIARRDRVGCTPGNRIGKGFEVDPYRIDRWKAQLLWLGAAPPHHQLGPSEHFGRRIATKGVEPEIGGG